MNHGKTPSSADSPFTAIFLSKSAMRSHKTRDKRSYRITCTHKIDFFILRAVNCFRRPTMFYFKFIIRQIKLHLRIY